jgi:hypothetical protein
LNAILLISCCGRVELLERLDLIVDRLFVFDVIEEILLDSLSNVCFDLSQLIFQASVFFDVLVVVAEILIVLHKRVLSRLSWWRSISVDSRCWSNRLLRLLEWTMELIRVNIFPYVACFSDALDNKDPEFPVALAVKDEVGCNGIFRHVGRRRKIGR